MLPVIVEVLTEVQVEMVLERSDSGISLGPLSAVGAEVAVAADEVLESCGICCG